MHDSQPNETKRAIAAIEHLHLQDPIPDRAYYCITMTADESGRIWRSVIGVFAGFTNTTPHFEIREASPVRPLKMRDVLRNIKEPPLMVNSEGDCLLFILLGGHAIIRQELAEDFFPAALGAKEVAPLGCKPGFIGADSVPRSKFVKRPRPWIKQKVRERDGNKCKVCNRGVPDGVELTLHHITMRKWAGFTEVDNLVLICGERHDELDDINNLAMYEWIGVDRYATDTTGREYRDAVIRYRRISFSEYRKQKDGQAP